MCTHKMSVAHTPWKAHAAALLVWLGLALAGTAMAAEPVKAEAAALVITYQVALPDRPALRRELETGGIRKLQLWKDSGFLADYRLYYNRFADSDNWDAMALLSFASPTAALQWQAADTSAPEALTPQIATLVRTIHATPVTMARRLGSAPASAHAVAMVIPYLSLVSSSDYLKYADGYMGPQFEGMIQESALSHYELFLSTFPTARPWSSLVVLEYQDSAALATRDAYESRVRSRLAQRPEWKAFSDTKKSIREEKQVVIAEPITLH